MTTVEKQIQTFFAITLLILASFSFTLVSCKDQKPVVKPTPAEKIENKVNDALDRRPGEKVLDAAEKARAEERKAEVGVQEAVK